LQLNTTLNTESGKGQEATCNGQHATGKCNATDTGRWSIAKVHHKAPQTGTTNGQNKNKSSFWTRRLFDLTPPRVASAEKGVEGGEGAEVADGIH